LAYWQEDYGAFWDCNNASKLLKENSRTLSNQDQEFKHSEQESYCHLYTQSCHVNKGCEHCISAEYYNMLAGVAFPTLKERIGSIFIHNGA
jgi:superfamily II helicase